MEMIQEEGWSDIGANYDKCLGQPNQPTCHTNPSAQETRIDYCIANATLAPSIIKMEVDRNANFPTHRPIRVEIATEWVQHKLNILHTATNLAELFLKLQLHKLPMKKGGELPPND